MLHNNLCNPWMYLSWLEKKMRISFSIRAPWRSGTLNNRWYYSHYLCKKKNTEIRWFLCKVTESIRMFLTSPWDSESCTFPCWDPQWVHVFSTSDQRLCLCPVLVFHMVRTMSSWILGSDHILLIEFKAVERARSLKVDRSAFKSQLPGPHKLWDLIMQE